MSKIFNNLTDLIGGTPLLRLHRLGKGLGAEVVGGHELWLARRLGVPGADIVFNGPAKTDEELSAALRALSRQPE